jgi:hypothetical protein
MKAEYIGQKILDFIREHLLSFGKKEPGYYDEPDAVSDFPPPNAEEQLGTFVQREIIEKTPGKPDAEMKKCIEEIEKEHHEEVAKFQLTVDFLRRELEQRLGPDESLDELLARELAKEMKENPDEEA